MKGSQCKFYRIERKNITKNFLFFSRIIDLFSDKFRERREEKYFGKMKPLVTFTEAPKDCRFEFVITTSYGRVINYIEECKMEVNKGYQTKPDRFVDSKNLKRCTSAVEAKFRIHVRLMVV